MIYERAILAADPLRGVASTTGMLLAISGGAAALSAGVIGYTSDRVGYKPILAVNLILTAVSLLFHGMAQNITQMALLRVLYGIAAGGIIPTMNALVGLLIPPTSYGKAYGLTAAMTCLGMAAGPLFGGIMASHWGYRWPFVAIGVIMILVALPVIASIRHRSH